MKILMVSWEYPPVVSADWAATSTSWRPPWPPTATRWWCCRAGPSDTDPATHPTTDEVSEGVRVIAAAHDPHEFDFGRDMMAWTLAMGHAMTRAGLRLHAKGWQPDVVHAHDWLVAHPAIALAEFFDVPMVSTIHATEAGRHSGWVSGRISRQVHARRVVAGPGVRLTDRLLGVDGRGDHRAVRARPGRDHRHPQRNRLQPLAVRASPPPRRPAGTAVLRPAGVREGRSRRDRRAAPDPAHPSRHHADDRR